MVRGKKAYTVLMIAHIGETLGHLVRGLAIADALTKKGICVEFAASKRAKDLLDAWPISYKLHPLRWTWSHNAVKPNLIAYDFFNRTLESVSDIMELLKNRKPDLIIGLPGIVSTQAARYFGIPHVSILHGPYLSPIIRLKSPNWEEKTILDFSTQICYEQVNIGFSLLQKVFSVPKLDYQTYLDTETILVPQPDLPLISLPNIFIYNFIRASFGPKFKNHNIQLEKACYITFGSGNPCDMNQIILGTAEIFPFVLVTSGCQNLKELPRNVYVDRYIASSSLAGKVAAVISHGGIGTVGTFAEFATPQMIIPTELDQATMAVHARRMGIAYPCGLQDWTERHKLGRRLPKFSKGEFKNVLSKIYFQKNLFHEVSSNGADQIALKIEKILDQNKISFNIFQNISG